MIESLQRPVICLLVAKRDTVQCRKIVIMTLRIVLIFSVVSMNWVSVENALSAYLPDTTETSQGLDRMEEQFITYGTAKVMVMKNRRSTAAPALPPMSAR